MKQVFGMEPDQLIKLAVASTKQIRALADTMPESDIRYEFSPEVYRYGGFFFGGVV